MSRFAHPFCFCLFSFLSGAPGASLQRQTGPELIAVTCLSSSAATHSLISLLSAVARVSTCCSSWGFCLLCLGQLLSRRVFTSLTLQGCSQQLSFALVLQACSQQLATGSSLRTASLDHLRLSPSGCTQVFLLAFCHGHFLFHLFQYAFIGLGQILLL